MKELLPLFSRPSHYLGTEINSIHKDPDSVRAHVALAFPDLYDVGMSYLGQKILYDVINQHPEFYAERVFAPTLDVVDVLRQHQTALATLESDTPLHKLDAVLFSLTHELCYTNVLYMLDAAQIPLHAAQRGPEHPLIIAGGGCTCNAEPVAPFFDVMVLGDGEEIVLEILDLLGQSREQGWERSALIQALASLPGIYVPGFGAGDSPLPMVEKRLVRDMNQALFPTRQIVPFGKPVHDRFSVEIARGCTRGCRFCQAGMIYRPVRERSVDTLSALISQGLAATGSEELSFLSLSTGDFSSLEALFLSSYRKCLEEQVSISLPSLRVGSVSAELMALMGRIRHTGLTLAPEAGTQRLRDVINKGVTEEALLAHTAQAFELGWQQVKLYFMIGLPTETTADLDGILDLCLKVAASAGPKAKRLQITAAVSPFVPKPHTPFQWEAQISMEETEERIAYLRSLFRPYKKLKLKWHHSHMSFLEGVFSRGDRHLAKVVEDAYQRGAVFTSWSDHLDLEPWQAAFAEAGITASDYLLARDLDQPLPWDHLQCGVSREFLLTERARALREAQTPDCRYAACRSCGVCTLDGRTSLLTEQARAGEILPVVNLAQRDQEQGSAPESVQRTEDMHYKARRFRLWYSKIGPARYLSQLELQRIFERAFRRVALPLSFSSGFHPAPLVSFARALPVGVGSVCEWMDFFVRERIEPDTVLTRLHHEFPGGMRAVQVQELACQGKAPVSVGETFTLSFSRAQDEERYAHALQEFMRAETWVVPKLTKKGEPGELDIRSMVADARLAHQGYELEFDWRGGYVSPVFILQGIDGEFSLLHGQLTKIGQYFDNGTRHCPS